jgi:hypothetical protein
MDPIDIRFVKFVEAVEKTGLDIKSRQVQKILWKILETGVPDEEDLDTKVQEIFQEGDPVWLYYLGEPTPGKFVSLRFCGESAVVDLNGYGKEIVPLHKLSHGKPPSHQ